MKTDVLDYYKKLVEFLGHVMGEHAEIVLRDCRKPNHDIVAIANGHVTGRTIGAPITDFTMSILANEEWKEKDYVVNYLGKGAVNKKLRSSTFFIRENGELIGQLCINIDMTIYQGVIEQIQTLSGMNLIHGIGETELICDVPVENLTQDAIGETLSKVVTSVVGSSEAIVRERLTQQDRIQIISELNKAGLFQIKGTVGRVAEYLYCSEGSVYRYQAKIQKKSQ